MARGRTTNNNSNGKRLTTQQSVDQAVKSICDIMRRGNCAGAMQYVPELTWILFLRILDEREEREKQDAKALGVPFRPSLESPYRWCDWATPPETLHEGKTNKRQELREAPPGSFFDFVNNDLLRHLKRLKEQPNATPRQKVISEIMTGVQRVRIDTERNFLDVLDKVHELSSEAVDPTHVFMLSQVYEGLLLDMGEKGNDGGQFFTPRQVIKAMVEVIKPVIDETVYDPGCGTGGFLAQAHEYIKGNLGRSATPDQLTTLKERTFWGREKENLIYPIALANLILHAIDKPNIWHGNTLTDTPTYSGLFEDAPQTFDVILTNPPFGGKEGPEAQTRYPYRTGFTQALFLQDIIIYSLRDGGRCGMVLDEGLLFSNNQDAFVKTKRKLLDDCDLWCVVSLPAGVFTGAGVKTNLLFFTKGKPTHTIWYYDLTDINVRKKTPLTLEQFDDFFRLLPDRADSALSWTVDMDERKRVAREEAIPFKEQAATKTEQATELRKHIKDLKQEKPPNKEAIEQAKAAVKKLDSEARELTAKAKAIEDAVYDLKAVNPNKKQDVDARAPEELVAVIEERGREIAEALAWLKGGGEKGS